ncbi:MAG: hypothetical protein KDA84_05125 [Planctomycetaceae bacterium]|nr:hypothetical protein [Planctomycetaceae bacterium]
MSKDGQQDKFRLGFLTEIRIGERGYVGGLLVTNHLGRPLEFQCTAPVKPNRTQEILYGPTLETFLLAELIGRTLVEKIGVKPHLVLVEREELLELRRHINVPVACLVESLPSDQAGIGLGRQSVIWHSEFKDDGTTIKEGTKCITADADLSEPFQRVRDALSEALGTGSPPQTPTANPAPTNRDAA